MFKKPSLEILKLEFLARLILLVVTFMSLFRPFLAFTQGVYYPFDFMSPAIFIFFLALFSLFLFSPRLNALAYYSISPEKREKILFKPSLGWLALIIWLFLALFLTAIFLRMDINNINNFLQFNIFLISFGFITLLNPINLILNLVRAFYSFSFSSQTGRFWIFLRVSYIFTFLGLFWILSFSSLSSRFFYFLEDFFILLNLTFLLVIFDAILAYFENGFLTKNNYWLQDI